MTEPTEQQWIIFLRPARATFPADATAEELDLVSRHSEHLQRALDRGQLILAGRTLEDADPVGIAILTGVSESEARRIVDDDPAVRSGLFRAELRAYRVAIARSEMAG